MKRSLILLALLFFSLAAFSTTSYNVIKAPNLNITEANIQKNNLEIEQRVKAVFSVSAYSDNDIKNIIKKEYNLWSADSDATVNSYADTIKLVFANVKYEIKEINYLSEGNAKIQMTISVPDTNGVFSDDQQNTMLAVTEKRFKDETGLSVEDALKTKELEAKYAPIMSSIYFKVLGENIKNIKTFTKSEVSYNMKKTKNNWTFEDESLNFFVK